MSTANNITGHVDPPDSEVMSCVLRMVIPMKREFGNTLNVQQFLYDRNYASEVVAQALASKDERLKGYATYVQTKLWGARGNAAPESPAAKTASPQAAETLSKESSVTDDARAQAIARYKSGLR